MNLEKLIGDKTIKLKEKVVQIGNWLLREKSAPEILLGFANNQTGSARANCFEAFEYATKQNPGLANKSLLAFGLNGLKEAEPRIKWESAKLIGNIASLFPEESTKIVSGLLANVAHEGTVVRWATAYALVEVAKIESAQQSKLLARIAELAEKENDNGVKKKYLAALKKRRS